jgi:Domain of unknown function (DUF5658)
VAGIRLDWIDAVVARSSRFGNAMVLVFLLAQAVDGVFTYMGVVIYGMGAEGNPLLGWLMGAIGCAAGVTAAKAAAGAFGIVLHLVAVHRVVAALALFYVAVAIVPWIGVLFF